jgi:hypothetical protein
LANACGSDEQLRGRVEALLRANDQAEDFLEVSSQRREISSSGIVGEKPGDRIGRYKLCNKWRRGVASCLLRNNKKPCLPPVYPNLSPDVALHRTWIAK